MFIYVLGLNSVFCKLKCHPNSFDSNISREYYSHGEGNARVKMGKKKENQTCLETIWKLCVYLKKKHTGISQNTSQYKDKLSVI